MANGTAGAQLFGSSFFGTSRRHPKITKANENGKRAVIPSPNKKSAKSTVHTGEAFPIVTTL